MIHITEDKLKAAIQICLGGDRIYTEQREAKLVHDIKALSIADVVSSAFDCYPCDNCGRMRNDKPCIVCGSD